MMSMRPLTDMLPELVPAQFLMQMHIKGNVICLMVVRTLEHMHTVCNECENGARQR
jgi:hypothetical protein